MVSWQRITSYRMPMAQRITGLLRNEDMCILWALEGFRGSHYWKVELVSDCVMAMTKLLQPRSRPRYENLSDKIGFEVCDFHSVWTLVNTIGRAIAKSVTREVRFQSYMAVALFFLPKYELPFNRKEFVICYKRFKPE